MHMHMHMHMSGPCPPQVAGVAEAERTPERAAACEAALAPALRRCYAETAAVARRLKEERGMVVGVISNHLVTPGLFGYCAEGARLPSRCVSHPLWRAHGRTCPCAHAP